MRARRLLVLVSLAPLAGGAALLADQAWLGAKAVLAERLIDRAFAAHLRDGLPHRPWTWADTHPIARLEVPRLGLSRTVLSGCSGSSMAFGPGHIDGSAKPNRPGNCALGGHRDSWFAFLEELRRGDRILLRTSEGLVRYRVSRLAVLPMWDLEPLEPTSGWRLTLITCYPFGGLRRTPWRYVVTCEADRAAPARRVSRLPRTRACAGGECLGALSRSAGFAAGASRSLPRGRAAPGAGLSRCAGPPSSRVEAPSRTARTVGGSAAH